MNEKKLEKTLNEWLDENSLEDFFEQFDLSAYEVAQLLYDEGMLDDDILMRMTPTDV